MRSKAHVLFVLGVVASALLGCGSGDPARKSGAKGLMPPEQQLRAALDAHDRRPDAAARERLLEALAHPTPRRILGSPAEPIRSVECQGAWILAIADDHVLPFDARTGMRRGRLEPEGARSIQVARLSPRGDRFVMADADGAIFGYRTATNADRTPSPLFERPELGARDVQFDRSGSTIFVHGDELLALLDTGRGRSIWELPARPGVLDAHFVEGTAGLILVRSDRPEILDVRDGATIGFLPEKDGYRIAQPLSGARLLLAETEEDPGAPFLFDAVKLAPVALPISPAESVARAHVSGRRAWIVTGNDEIIRVDADGSEADRFAPGFTPARLEATPDGRRLAAISADGEIAVFDTGTPEPIVRTRLDIGSPREIVWHPERTRFLVVTDDSQVHVLDIRGKLLTTLHEHDGAVETARWSFVGRWLLTVSERGVVRLYDGDPSTAEDAYRAHAKPGDGGQPGDLGADGSISRPLPGTGLTATGDSEGRIRLVDPATDEVLFTHAAHPAAIRDLVLVETPDGIDLVSTAEDGSFRVTPADPAGRARRLLDQLQTTGSLPESPE